MTYILFVSVVSEVILIVLDKIFNENLKKNSKKNIKRKNNVAVIEKT